MKESERPAELCVGNSSSQQTNTVSSRRKTETKKDEIINNKLHFFPSLNLSFFCNTIINTVPRTDTEVLCYHEFLIPLRPYYVALMCGSDFTASLLTGVCFFVYHTLCFACRRSSKTNETLRAERNVRNICRCRREWNTHIAGT